jgi:hypothetical protein
VNFTPCRHYFMDFSPIKSNICGKGISPLAIPRADEQEIRRAMLQKLARRLSTKDANRRRKAKEQPKSAD